MALSSMGQPVLAQTAVRAESSLDGLRLGTLYLEVERANPRVTGAHALVRAAQLRVPGAMRPPDPQLQIGIMNREVPSFAPMAPLGMTQVQVMQMLPLGGKLRLAGRVAAEQANATAERAQDVVWELRTQAAIAFYDLYAADRQLDVARETLRLLQDIARTVEAMYRVGEGRQADVLRAQVEIARMTEDTLRMRAMRETLVARMNALRDRNLDASIGAPVLPTFPAAVPLRESLDSMAMRHRPMIRAGVRDVAAAAAAATRVAREVIPDLQVGVQLGRQRASMAGSDPLGMPVSVKATQWMGSLMIGASIPIFARDRQSQMREEANAMKAMAEAELAAMRADTRGKIGEAYAMLMRARSLARLYRTTVLPTAEAAVASAFSAYRVGNVNFMTLLDDRMTVNEYRQNLHVLEAEEGKAWADLEMLIGRPLIDANSVALAAQDAELGTAPVPGGAR